MNDRFIKYVTNNCKNGNHLFSEWRPIENAQERHCVYCSHAEIITEEEIAKSIPDDVSKDQLD